MVFAILVATICYPVETHAGPQPSPQPGIKNIVTTRLIDDPTIKKTLFVITTEEDIYHIIVDANITKVGSETRIDLIATLYNPLNETITASVWIPDTLYDAPFYNGPVTAFHMHFDSATVNLLRFVLPIVTVVALFLQAVFIALLIFYVSEIVLLKTLFLGGPFIWASLPWVLLTLLEDADPVNGIDLYFPTSPASVLVNLIFGGHMYYIRTNLGWWKTVYHEVYTDIPLPWWLGGGVWHFVWFSYYTAHRLYVILPPIAEFGWTPHEPIVDENVTFDGSPSFAPSTNGYIVTYQWSLGDGNVATGKNFTYAYHNSGSYTVTLTVTDNNGLTGSVTHTIDVQPLPVAALRVIPDYLQVEVVVGESATAEFYVGETINQTDLLEVVFTAHDFSKTFDTQTIASGNVTFDKNGITVPKGTWTNVTVAFHVPPDSPTGWYSGKIAVTTANGGSSAVFVDLFVYGPPIANFTWSPLVPRVGELVTFDASSSIPGGQPIVDYEWDFGDSQKASGLTVVHTYTSAATYLVTLNVTDSNGLWNATQQQVTVQCQLTMATNFGMTTPSVGNHWYDSGSQVTISATAPPVGVGERYVWNGWTGTGTGSYTGTSNTATVTMSGPVTETASWTHQYYLTVLTNPSGIGMILGAGWYDANAAVPLKAPTNLGVYRLITMPFSWDVDGTPQGVANPITVTMNTPHIATAYYTNPSVGGQWAPITMQALAPSNTLQMLALWISLISLMALLTTSFVYIRRKKR
jgi:PKD repeat protein